LNGNCGLNLGDEFGSKANMKKYISDNKITVYGWPGSKVFIFNNLLCLDIKESNESKNGCGIQ